MRDNDRIDWQVFATDLKALIATSGKSIRELGRDVLLDFNTVQRAKYGTPVSASSFLVLCHWMKADPMRYLEDTWVKR